MVDRIRWDTVSYLPFYYIFFEIDFQFLLLTIINLQVKILAIKDILSNLVQMGIFFFFFFFFFLRDFIFKKTLFEKLHYVKQELSTQIFLTCIIRSEN